MKDTRKTKLLKSTLNKKLEDFRKFRISNIQEETVITAVEEVAIKANNEKTKSKGFFSKLLNK
jgi:hypothetical protein